MSTTAHVRRSDCSDGRHQSISTVAAKNRRKATVPKLPTSMNRFLASAEPNWTLTMPSRTNAGGGIADRARGRLAQEDPSVLPLLSVSVFTGSQSYRIIYF